MKRSCFDAHLHTQKNFYRNAGVFDPAFSLVVYQWLF